MIDIPQFIKEKAIEFFFITFVLGGILFAVVESYRTGVRSENLARQLIEKQAELSEINRENRVLLLELASKNNLEISEIESLFSARSSQPEYGDISREIDTFLNQQTDAYKRSIEIANEKLVISRRETELVMAQISGAILVQSHLLSDNSRSIRRNQIVKLENLYVRDEIRATANLLNIYNEGVSVVHDIENSFKVIDESLAQGTVVFNDINNNLLEVIVALQNRMGVFNIEGKTLEFHTRELKLHPLRQLQTKPYERLGELGKNIAEAKSVFRHAKAIGDDLITIKSNDVLELIEAKLELRKLMNARLGEMLTEIENENRDLNELTRETDADTVSLNEQLRIAQDEKEIWIAKLNDARKEFGSAFESLRASVEIHNQNLGSYSAEFDKNLGLLDRYFDLVSELGKDHRHDVN